MDSQNSKLFIKVNGVIGSRKQICTFCNDTIEGAEKIIETTRKLRCGPYFPQLAYLQSAVGKIDTLGRAVVCLSCFHQLLRQWSTYEHKNIPVQRRKYTYISDKGVKNYNETRDIEIRNEAEKRAFAIHTKQEHMVKKSFEKLTNILDNEEEKIKQCEERIIELKGELSYCTTGEHWKINREIQKQKKLISSAEFRIEEEEDKEEETRKQTKELLEVYRNNKSLFRAVSEPNLFSSNDNKKLVIFEQNIDYSCENVQENSPSDNAFLDSAADNRPQTTKKGREKAMSDKSSDQGYHVFANTIKAEGLSDVYVHGERDSNVVNSVDVWESLESQRGSHIGEQQGHYDSPPEWHLVKEIVHPGDASKSQSFQEDEWSKLSTEQHYHHHHHHEQEQQHHQQQQQQQQQRETVNQSSKNVYRDDNWNQQNVASLQGKDFLQEENNISVQRQNRVLEETDSDDSEEEKEQIYEVNPEELSRLSNTENTKHNEIPRTDYNHGKFTTNDSWSNLNNQSTETLQKHSTSSEDIWESIQTEKDQENNSQPRSFSHEGGKEEYYTDEYGQNIKVSINEKDILPPGRLDTSRFSEFTKSSYIPVKNQLTKNEKYQDNNRNTHGNSVKIERSIGETEVTIIEKRDNHKSNHGTNSFHGRNEPVASLRNNVIPRERHLSVEEEEWETKHHSPSRLNESVRFGFLNEQNNSGHIQERSGRSNKRSDSRDTSVFNNQTELHNEQSPEMRKLAKQGEVVRHERPIQKMTTKVSLQSDPWEDLDSKVVRQDSKTKTDESNRINEDNSPGKRIGKLDLKQWSFEVENNSVEETNERNIKQARSEGHFQETSMRSDRVSNENSSVKKQRTVSPQRKNILETVIIDEQESKLNDKGGDRTRKPVGKLNFDSWKQNDSPQSNMDGSSTISKVSPVSENKNNSFSQRTTRTSVKDKTNNKVEDDGRFVKPHSPTENSRIEGPNQSSQSSPEPKNLMKNTNKRSSFFNESMSEDELAWEKRFSKSYERSSSEDEDEDEKTQKNAMEQKTVRLVDGNSNHINVGKIVLDEEDMRRVRNAGSKTSCVMATEITSTTSTSHKNIDGQSEHLKYDDISQQSEEENAWEEKISTPGRLDFSKFSHFS